MERATLVACSPFGEKIVQWTILRVGRTGESPIFHTMIKLKSRLVLGLSFFVYVKLLMGLGRSPT